MINEKIKKVADSLKQTVFEESNFQCSYCGFRKGLNLTVHHIDHRGPNIYENLIALCKECQKNLHHTKKIKDNEIRRLKRSLVRAYLTQLTANALKLAYKNSNGRVVAPPFVMKHAEELGFVEYLEPQSYYGSMESSDRDINILAAIYKITVLGKSLVQKWILRSSD